jgi:hypothetical protein
MKMELKTFEVTYGNGRIITPKTKSRRTLDRRLSEGTRRNALIGQLT